MNKYERKGNLESLKIKRPLCVILELTSRLEKVAVEIILIDPMIDVKDARVLEKYLISQRIRGKIFKRSPPKIIKNTPKLQKDCRYQKWKGIIANLKINPKLKVGDPTNPNKINKPPIVL